MSFDRVRITSAGSVGPTVGRLILQSGMQRMDIARLAGVTDQSLRDWINGNRGMQSYNLVSVLDALGYDLICEKREGRT